MNILFVNNFKSRGGGEEFLRDLLPGLVVKGVKTGLVCRPGAPLEKMLRGTGVLVYPISRSGIDALACVFKMAKIIKSERYGIINIQRGHDICQSWAAAILARNKPELLYTVQIPRFYKSRFLLKRMKGIITVSNYIKEGLISYYPIISKKIKVINYGIDTARFRKDNVKQGIFRSRYKISPDERIIGTVGDVWKNQVEFLDALSEIKKVFPDVLFALAGSEYGGQEIKEFNCRVKELGLSDAILWLGRLSKEEMPLFYADIDIAVSTHKNEGFGIWVLEALAMGKPVIAFDAGGLRDSLKGCPAGVLIKGDAKVMASEIICILRDDDILERLSKAGPHWVRERFSRERMVDDYYNFFMSFQNY